ncbi:AAA family ATPase [Massilia forsythiae]|uniref:non-specific serine/threonine protein kinase n=1 Tax=Massilia forsythiae TaxID=2728020 RepID=A0A7Z2VYF3_9BURK|nr:ATPase domain-containing protein [Massilia forsythiae]QJE01741.1 AAA family ATPase [Massilia forsythiae]
MSDRVALGKLSTGVPGLDILLGGGLSEFSFTLIAGAPGSGKTTLAHQIMFALATPERRALFFTVLGEPPLKMLRYQQQFSFFDMDKVGTSIRYVNLADDLRAGDFSGVLERIMQEVEDFVPSLVFVDSFRSVVQTRRSGNEGLWDVQNFIQELGSRMATWQATTFLIGEYSQNDSEAHPIITVADGIVALTHNEYQETVVRKMRVIKMRGQPHMVGSHTMRITDDGIRVYPRQLVTMPDAYLGHDRDPRRVSTGVAGLDGLLHGGLPQGHTVLVTGPTGIGKTVLGVQFLKAGAAAGEHGVAVYFEKHTARLHNATLNDLVEDGKITIMDPVSLSLSIEEFLDELVQNIERTGATRVVIDSLSEIGLYLAPEFSKDLRLSVFRTLSMLAARGITTMVMSGIEDGQPGLQFSIDDLCFLADAVLVMRFAEVDGDLGKFMAVVKVRSSAHSTELRRYRIDTHGIQIDEGMIRYDGVLTGWPKPRPQAQLED